jgi:phenylacetic acid degradation operon negative regulatory protein
MNDQLRRRSVGPPAARSMLLTVLGEYVLPAPDGVWQETLIGALTALDYKTQAARQALARSVTGGWLRTERHGRRARVHLTGEAREMLSTGAERIYSFGAPWEWDGRWLLVVVRVPEERRDVRHLIRSRLAWAGFGSLGNGLWITPHAEREAEVRRDLPAAELLSFRAEFGSIGDPAKVVADAWDLDDVAARSSPASSACARPRRATRSVRRPSSCTRGASSRSWIPTCRRRRSPPAGRALPRSRCSPSATRSGRRPPRSGSSRF